ncbi:hypothetical protein F4859DRAFT_451743 [Xylaria cf. heliscus]|nr:hypothetical protein F4859DRAFT_451743 [Xylaria cf. heliscus]
MPSKVATTTSTSANCACDAAPKRAAKRKSTDHNPTTEDGGSKRARKSGSGSGSAAPEEEEEEEEEPRPRLTTPDLEFDYDTTRLRDPRPTPGRVRRPYLEDREVTAAFKQRFTIPVPARPKGRLSAGQKSRLFTETALLDPSAVFHDLYVCHARGPYGEPTYDSAGFQLDYAKVAEWMRPQAYNKVRMVRGMERSLERGQREQREIFGIFFVEEDAPDANALFVEQYVKDCISKDLGVPWHQIGSEQARRWKEMGFERKRFSEWWSEPNAEESKRMLKMMGGSRLRLDL